MIIHQTLHGYKDGHRLLAGSLALSAADERRMDALSDLSGYMDRGIQFDHYHTGYPCAGCWVLARTWMDEGAERRGTVLTHSLLLPPDLVTSLDDWGVLGGLFRRPMHPLDLRSYRTPLTLPSLITPTPPMLDLSSRRALGWAFLGQERRPILWEDPTSAEAACRQIWIWSPPWVRLHWSFCSFALQPRYLVEEPLDLLCVASPGNTTFYKLQERSARAGGRVPAATPSDPAWLALLDLPAYKIQQIWRNAREGGLGELPVSRLRLALQHEALDSREDMGARLAQLDVLEGLQVVGGATAERDVARALALLSEGQVALTVVHDLLVRGPSIRAPALEEKIASAVFSALAGPRATPSPDELRRLPVLLRDSPLLRLETPVKRGVLARVRRSQDLDGWLIWLRALSAWDMEFARDALRGVDEQLLAGLLPRLLEEKGALLDLGAWLARARPPLLAELLRRHTGTMAARRWLGLLWHESLDWSTEEWADVLDAPSPDDLIDASRAEVERLPEPGASILARRLAEALNLPEIFARAPVWIHGPAFDVQAERSLERLLGSSEEVLPWLAVSGHLVESSVLRQLVEHARVDVLCSPELTPWLLESRAAGWAARRVLVPLLEAVLADEAPVSAIDPWLRVAAEHLDRGELGKRLCAARGAALPRAVSVLARPMARSLRERRTLERCLSAWGERMAMELQQEPAPWLELLEVLRRENREAAHALCGLMLGAALDDPRPEGASLAVASFETIHRALCEDTRYDWLNPFKLVARWWGMDWDRAKHLRAKVAEAWVRGRWPPETLIALAGQDADLLEKLVKRALEQPDGAIAIARLRRGNVPAWARTSLLLD